MVDSVLVLVRSGKYRVVGSNGRWSVTTILCNRDMMVCDSCVVMDQLGVYPTNKFRRVGASLFGIAGGDCESAERVFEWVDAGRNVKDRPKAGKRDDYFILELNPSGIYIATQNALFEKIELPFFAIGSGRKVARYCMEELGMDPVQAVFKACEYDKPWSNPPVYWERLSGEKGVHESCPKLSKKT